MVFFLIDMIMKAENQCFFAQVVSFDEPEDPNIQPSVTLADGRIFSADIIIGADGIKSQTRELVLGFSDAPKSSGYACYRAYFRPSPSLRSSNPYINNGDCVNIWIGPDMHLVQNTLRDGEEFNWILTHKDSADIAESWFTEGNMDDVRELVKGWDPEITDAIKQTENCLDWKICYRDPIPTWVSKTSHRIVLLGDSCHPHLPTSAQGASQAVESAAVLALCLKMAGKGRLPIATRVYEKLRFDRVRQAQLNGEDVRDRWHNALKSVEADLSIDPDDVKIKVSSATIHNAHCLTLCRIAGYIPLTPRLMLVSDGMRCLHKWNRSLQAGSSSHCLILRLGQYGISSCMMLLAGSKQELHKKRDLALCQSQQLL